MTEKRLGELIEELDLAHIGNRIPLNLSGGELQRVALARALMVNPGVLLLDEPLAALDPVFREEIRHELKRLHRSSNATFLMVTHDFAEALSLADRGAVISRGRIEQIGTMEDLFQRPSTEFIADFVGMKNIFAAEFSGSRALIGEGFHVELGRRPSNSHGYIAIRPEDIVIHKKALASSMRNSFGAIVKGLFDQGFYYEVHLQVGKLTFKSLITKKSLFELQIHEGAEILLSFKSAAIHTF